MNFYTFFVEEKSEEISLKMTPHTVRCLNTCLQASFLFPVNTFKLVGSLIQCLVPWYSSEFLAWWPPRHSTNTRINAEPAKALWPTFLSHLWSLAFRLSVSVLGCDRKAGFIWFIRPDRRECILNFTETTIGRQSETLFLHMSSIIYYDKLNYM